MRRRALVAALLALVVASCGSGSSGSIDRLRADATRACRQALDRGSRIRAPAIPAQVSTFLRGGLAVLRPELADLRTLRPPSGQAGTYAAALEALERELTILTSTVHDLDRGADPQTTIRTLAHRLRPVEANGDAAWRTLGVPACVNR
jgi:hypothetical protein